MKNNIKIMTKQYIKKKIVDNKIVFNPLNFIKNTKNIE